MSLDKHPEFEDEETSPDYNGNDKRNIPMNYQY